LCDAGTYSIEGASSCDGECVPGYYSLPGAGSCSPCLGGRFGYRSRSESAQCDGECPAGSYCPSGSTQVRLSYSC
jgi:hypothetical protein